MNREDLIDLVSQLDKKLATPDTSSAFHITLERFSEDCANVGELISFLKDAFVPGVVREFRLEIWSGRYPKVFFDCDSMWARYWIYNASDTSEARLIEDIIVEFRKKHGASRLLTWMVGWFLSLGLSVLVVLELVALAALPTILGAYRYLHFIFALCSITFLAYMIWSFFTSEPPSFSFRHSLLYMGKEPRQHVVWALVSAFVIEIAAAVVVSYIIHA